MPSEYPIFGVSNSTEMQSASLRGMSGYFTVPPGFALSTDANQQVWATNPDTGKVYAAQMDYDGTLRIQDLLLSMQCGR